MQRPRSLSTPRTSHRVHHRAGGGCRRGCRQALHARSPLAPRPQPPTEERWCFLPKMTKSRTSPPDSLAAPRALPRRVQRPPLSRCGEHRHRQQPPLFPASLRSSTQCHRLNRHQTGHACRAPHQHHSDRSPESHPQAWETSLPAHHVENASPTRRDRPSAHQRHPQVPCLPRFPHSSKALRDAPPASGPPPPYPHPTTAPGPPARYCRSRKICRQQCSQGRHRRLGSGLWCLPTSGDAPP